MKLQPTVALGERRHWVFDLDGTLTVAVHDFAVIRNELGVPDGSDILDYLASLPEQDALVLHNRLQRIELELAGATVAAAGAPELLLRLRDKGSRLGILTRNTRENAVRTLDLIGLGGYFETGDILGREQALPKPDPDGIFRLASRWGSQPSETVMVGDYLYDLQAGRRAGALTVHVDVTGGFCWPEYTDLSVETLEDVMPWITE
ncbi:MAG: HAD family hydrolase [Desulfuromonadales bacterium]|nr:HAD family hydrolase [Desulfuromonadales bacterium]